MKSALENMKGDYEKLQMLKEGDPPILHFYEWSKPSFTYGYFSKPEEYLNLDQLFDDGFDFAKRPTGGGVIFHTHDLAFSILIPKGNFYLKDNTLENYSFINQNVKEAIEPFIQDSAHLLPCCSTTSALSGPFCMAKPTVFDVMVQHKKVGGAAQRRTKTGLLHQGSLSINIPDWLEMESYFKDHQILSQMKELSFSLNCSRNILVERLIKQFSFLTNS